MGQFVAGQGEIPMVPFANNRRLNIPGVFEQPFLGFYPFSRYCLLFLLPVRLGTR